MMISHSPAAILLIIVAAANGIYSAKSFVLQRSMKSRPLQLSDVTISISNTLSHGLRPLLLSAKSSKQPEDEKPKKLSFSSVIQLITAGAGAPFLGDFEGVDKETGKFMFSLEANNLVDEDGNSKQTKMPYFEQGWVDPDDTGFRWPWEKKK
jgi:hypothetical protein